MIKTKASKGVPNKALHSRVSYLYQAATYLATQQQTQPAEDTSRTPSHQGSPVPESQNGMESASRRLFSDLRAVSLKAQLRMSPAMKNSICKNCDTMLVDGFTCTTEIENRSKGGKKAWADVLVRKCDTCGTAKRFPLSAKRQKRKPLRAQEDV